MKPKPNEAQTARDWSSSLQAAVDFVTGAELHHLQPNLTLLAGLELPGEEWVPCQGVAGHLCKELDVS